MFFLFYKQVFGRSYVAQVESFKQKKNGQKSRDTLPLKPNSSSKGANMICSFCKYKNFKISIHFQKWSGSHWTPSTVRKLPLSQIGKKGGRFSPYFLFTYLQYFSDVFK